MTGGGGGWAFPATRSNWSSEYVLTQNPEQRGPHRPASGSQKVPLGGKKVVPIPIALLVTATSQKRHLQI